MAQHAAKGARFQAVTANRLSDGEVVYWAADNRWAERFIDAEIADGAEAADALLARAMPADFEAHVLEPYLFEVLEDGKFYKPVRFVKFAVFQHFKQIRLSLIHISEPTRPY